MYSELDILTAATQKAPSYADEGRGAFPLPASVQTAIVHDWLPVYAGAERVLEQMINVLPSCELYSLIDFLPDDQRAFLQGKTVTTSLIQRLPFARKQYRNYLPVVPFATEQFDLRGYDVVVSSSYVAAKGVLTSADQLHISYVHSPVRYAWDLYFQYLEEGNLTRGLKGLLAKAILHYMRLYDVACANRVDHFVANSRTVARRIWKTYRRKADVVYPPVDTEAFALQTKKDGFYLTASRLVPYKRIDLIVEAFAQMPDRELVVIGDGPEYARIAAKAGPNVTMLGYQPFDTLRDYMQRARAFVFAAEEDFGIIPVEAQACGTPVVAYGKGGATETVVAGETGVFFYEQTTDGIQAALDTLDENYALMDPHRIRENAQRFSAERFRAAFGDVIDRVYTQFMTTGIES